MEEKQATDIQVIIIQQEVKHMAIIAKMIVEVSYINPELALQLSDKYL